jgi:hypothetical protein
LKIGPEELPAGGSYQFLILKTVRTYLNEKRSFAAPLFLWLNRFPQDKRTKKAQPGGWASI